MSNNIPPWYRGAIYEKEPAKLGAIRAATLGANGQSVEVEAQTLREGELTVADMLSQVGEKGSVLIRTSGHIVQINAAGEASYWNISRHTLKPEPTYLGYASPDNTVKLHERLSLAYSEVPYEPGAYDSSGWFARSHMEDAISPEGEILECLMLSDVPVPNAEGLTLTGTPRAYQDPVNYRHDVGER